MTVGLGVCGFSQSRLERRDSVELHTGQAANETRAIVSLNEDGVYGSSFYAEVNKGEELVKLS